MPVKIPSGLPAIKHLESENIFVMPEQRAASQDIRPLKLAILNLMPDKEVTETQLLRLIGNTPLQIDIIFLKTATYEGTHTPQEHLANFYRTFHDVKKEMFDGLIITGAPVEKLEFSEVLYWDELKEIMEWSKSNVYSTFYICWAAQAGLYYHYGIGKHHMDKKLSGIYNHKVLNKKNPLTFGFDDYFLAPHSRYTEIKRSDIEKSPVEILAESDTAGVYLCASPDLRYVFVTGHGEYDADTLHKEYLRDLEKGIKIHMPDNYYRKDDIGKLPYLSWRSHASLLFMNWLNYAVYQNTPYDITKISR